jgi:hypothetical protein
MIIAYVCSTWSIVKLKKRFETWITRNYVNGVSLFNLTYLITLMTYLCSLRTPNVQMEYFMFDWSILTLFVLNRGWKRDSLQIMIFVYVYLTWDSGTKNAFWDLNHRNNVNVVSLLHLSHLINLWLSWAHNGHQMSK